MNLYFRKRCYHKGKRYFVCQYPDQEDYGKKTVAETDNGLKIKERIAELQELLKAYRDGLLIEKL